MGSSQAAASRSRAVGLDWNWPTRAHQDSGASSNTWRIWVPMSVRSRRSAHQGRLPLSANTRSSSSTGRAGGSAGLPCSWRARTCRRAVSSRARNASSKPVKGRPPRSTSTASRRSQRSGGLSSVNTRCSSPSRRGSLRLDNRSISGRACCSSGRRSSIVIALMRWPEAVIAPPPPVPAPAGAVPHRPASGSPA